MFYLFNLFINRQYKKSTIQQLSNSLGTPDAAPKPGCLEATECESTAMTFWIPRCCCQNITWLTSLYIDIIECVRHVFVGRQCVLVWLSNVSVLPRCLLNTSLKNKLWSYMFSFKFWVEWPFTAYHQYCTTLLGTCLNQRLSAEQAAASLDRRTDSGGFLFYHLLFLKWVWLNMLGKKQIDGWLSCSILQPNLAMDGHGISLGVPPLLRQTHLTHRNDKQIETTVPPMMCHPALSRSRTFFWDTLVVSLWVLCVRSSGGVQRPTEVKRSSGLYKEKDPGLMQVPSNWAHQDFGHETFLIFWMILAPAPNKYWQLYYTVHWCSFNNAFVIYIYI